MRCCFEGCFELFGCLKVVLRLYRGCFKVSFELF